MSSDSRHEFASTADGTGPADLLLVQRALRGEADAVDGVLSRLSCIVRFVYRLNKTMGCGLPADALEDVVQQVYAAVWPRLRDFAGSAALESWVFGFCRNCLRAERRQRHGLRIVATDSGDVALDELTGSGASPEHDAERAEDVDALWDEIDRLDDAERDVVWQRHFEGWSFERIAHRQGVPASTVKDRCYRALTRIKARLQRRDVRA